MYDHSLAQDLIRVPTAECSGLPPNWSLNIAPQVIAELIGLSAAIRPTSFTRQGKREIWRYADMPMESYSSFSQVLGLLCTMLSSSQGDGLLL
jgi:hypothetical protein